MLRKVKGSAAMQETKVQSLAWEDPLEKRGRATQSNSLAEEFTDRGDGQATVHGLASQAQLS